MENHEMENDEFYDFEGSEVCSDDLPMLKKRKLLSEDERLKRCRERNRIHARNTRERKKLQLDVLQLRIKELMAEKMMLKNSAVDTSVASILMSLAGGQYQTQDQDPITEMESALNKTASEYANMTIEKLRLHISLETDEDEFQMDQTLMQKDKASCSVAELESIRRERNRMHAKKTRMRKKKMLEEMETIVYALEEEIQQIKSASDDHSQSSSGRVLSEFVVTKSLSRGQGFNESEFSCQRETEESVGNITLTKFNTQVSKNVATSTSSHSTTPLSAEMTIVAMKKGSGNKRLSTKGGLSVESTRQELGHSCDASISSYIESHSSTNFPIHASAIGSDLETVAMQSHACDDISTLKYSNQGKDTVAQLTPKSVVHRICTSDSSGNDDDDDDIRSQANAIGGVALAAKKEGINLGQGVTYSEQRVRNEPKTDAMKSEYTPRESDENIPTQSVF